MNVYVRFPVTNLYFSYGYINALLSHKTNSSSSPLPSPSSTPYLHPIHTLYHLLIHPLATPLTSSYSPG